MINSENGIPCPVCATKISFDIQQLLSGVQFTCPNCLSSIGLAKESAPIVAKTLDKLEEHKKKIKEL